MILTYNEIYVAMKHDEVDTWEDAYDMLCEKALPTYMISMITFL